MPLTLLIALASAASVEVPAGTDGTSMKLACTKNIFRQDYKFRDPITKKS